MSGCAVDSEEGSLRAATIVHISRYPLRWCNPVTADAERRSLKAASVPKTRVRGAHPISPFLRIAISGTHCAGKSTLLDDVIERLPHGESIAGPFYVLEEE